MSLHIYIYDHKKKSHECICECCGNKHKYKSNGRLCCINITHNLAKMASECGLYDVLWRADENNIKTGKDAIKFLEEGIKKLENCPNEYKKFNPKNGWGSYELLLIKAKEYLNVCKQFPKSTIEVCR